MPLFDELDSVFGGKISIVFYFRAGALRGSGKTSVYGFERPAGLAACQGSTENTYAQFGPE